MTSEDVLTRDADTDTDTDGQGLQVDRQETRPKPGFAGRRPALSVSVLALMSVAAVITAAVLGWQLREKRAVENAGQQALAAAQEYALVLTSVDAGALDQKFASAIDGATGEFKDMYRESSAQLKQVLIDSKADADGTVVAAAVRSATTDTVEVMLFVDQAVTNALNPEPRVDRNRIIMTMAKVDGRWLAANVDLP